MKTMKNFIIYLVACTSIFVAGCTEERTEEFDSRLKVIESQLDFASSGGTGKIVVEQTGVNATSNAGWCTVSVSGNVVNVTVAQHTELPNRTAVVTIKSENKSINVPVTQTGTRFIFDNAEISVPFTASVVKRPVSSDVSVEIESESNWIHASVVADTLYLNIDENPVATLRTGNVKLSAGIVTITLVVKQAMKPAINALFISRNWYFAYSGLGSWTKQYWDYCKVALDGLWGGAGEELQFAYLGTDSEKYGFHFSCFDGADYWDGGLLYTYTITGDDKIQFTFASQGIGEGAWYYQNARFDYLTYPIAGTFTLTTDNITSPTWVLLTDDNRPGNSMKLYPTQVTKPFTK
jgi:hypothetical protein